MTILPGPVEMPEVREIEARHGSAYANFRPNSRWPDSEVGLVVGGQRLVCTRGEAKDALAVLAELFGPLAESRRVAARVARYGQNGGQDAR